MLVHIITQKQYKKKQYKTYTVPKRSPLYLLNNSSKNQHNYACAYHITFHSHLVFTARRNARIASAVLATAIPFIRLSHAGIVSKRLHVAWCSLHSQIAKCV